MRRFEQILKKPSPFWEVEIAGAQVRTRAGGGGAEPVETTSLHADAAAAADHVAQEIATRRAAGFVEIVRIAEAADEPRVTRTREVTWSVGPLRHVRVVRQCDRSVRVEHAHQFRDGRVPGGAEDQMFPTIAAASAHFDRVLAESRGGLATSSRRPRAEHTSDPGLEALCRASADASAWTVYADWLIARADPRGEIAGLALGGKLLEARAVLEARYSELWDDGVALAFDLRHGFVRGVQIELADGAPAPRPLLDRVLGSPLCRFVDAIAITTDVYVRLDWDAALAAICDAPQALQLRTLHLRSGDERSDTGCDFAPAWASLPALGTVELALARGTCALGSLEAPRLRTLVREASALERGELQAITSGDLSRLEHLAVGFGKEGAEDPPHLADLAPIFDAVRFRALRHLGLLDRELDAPTMAALVDSRLLPQLESLDLSRAWGDALVAQLVANAPAFRHLAALDLSDAELTAADLDRIRGALDNVILGPPVEDDERYDDVDAGSAALGDVIDE